MQITSVRLVEVGNLEEQYRHPLELSSDRDTISLFSEVLESSRGGLTPGLFSSAGAGLLRPSHIAEHIDVRGINGRWNEKRFRFVVEIEIEPITNYRPVGTRVIVTGYTDRCEVSLVNDLIEDETQMYVNSVIMVRDKELKDKRGNIYISSTLVESSQSMLGWAEFDNRRMEYLMRPWDLFNTLQTQDDTNDGGDYIDYSATFQKGVTINERRNNHGGQYLFNLTNSDVSAYNALATYNDDMYSRTREAEAADTVRPRQVKTHPFLKAICSHSDYQRNNYFEYQDLAAFTHTKTMKELDQITDYIKMDLSSRFYESNTWNGASETTMAALHICHVIPVIMLDCMFDSITAVISNIGIDRGQHGDRYCRHDNTTESIVLESTSIIGENMDDLRLFDVFLDRLKREVFDVITNHGYLECELDVESDIGGLTRITLTLDGSQEEPYVFPTFADSMLSPVITEDNQLLNDNAMRYRELRKVVDNVMLDDDRTYSRIVGADGRQLKRESADTADRPRRAGNPTTSLFDL